MRKTIIAALLLAALASQASAQGWIHRVTGAGRALVARSDATIGTVMRTAPIGDAAGREAVLILDTVLKNRLGCFVVDLADLGRVEPWGTFVAISYTGEVVEMGELECRVVKRFRARKEGNPSRRDFLATHSLPILAYGLRHYPEAAARFFPRGSELAPIAAELGAVEAMLVHVGALDPDDDPPDEHLGVLESTVLRTGDQLAACLQRETELVASCRGLPAGDVGRCETALRSSGALFEGIRQFNPITAASGLAIVRGYFGDQR